MLQKQLTIAREEDKDSIVDTRYLNHQNQSNVNDVAELAALIRQSAGEGKALIALGLEDMLGSFDSLPADIQSAIVQEIVARDRWSMAGHELGRWQFMPARAMLRARRGFAARGWKRLAGIAAVATLILRSGPAHAIRAVREGILSLQSRVAASPSLSAALCGARMDPRDFAVCYARGIPQKEPYRGLWHDEALHNTWGMILGIDLLPSPEGYWFVESNLDFGLSNTRSQLYARDPYVSNLVAFSAENGYRHLILVYKNSSHMEPSMAKQFEHEVHLRGLDLKIIEDPYLPESSYTQSYGIPPVEERDTLVARSRFYRTSLDHLLQHKQASARALETYRRATNDLSLLLPPFGPDPVPGDASSDQPFPNLVYKLPERDAGGGVLFIKAASVQDAYDLLAKTRARKASRLPDRLYSLIEDSNGFFQSYIVPTMLDNRRLFKVRAHLFLTPVGVRFLSAHKVVSRFPVPERLPMGVVADPRPYLVNLASSSQYEAVSGEEEKRVAEAARSVAEGLLWAVRYGFQTGPVNGSARPVTDSDAVETLEGALKR